MTGYIGKFTGGDANSQLEVAIAHRRRRLSLDYKVMTRARLAAHSDQTHRRVDTVSRCLTTLQRQFLPHYFASPPAWRMRIRQFPGERALPDFCIIGPAKSGSSDLAITVMAHPNVLCPLVKEFPSSDPRSWKPFYPTLRAVQRHAHRHGLALCAYVAPRLHFLDIPIALSSIRPHTKIIINLRNPVDLVFSMWKWTVLHLPKEHVDRIPFLTTFPAYVESAVRLFPEAPAPFGPALHFGIYATSVTHWLRAFGDGNVRIFDISDYFKDRGAYFERLEQFLGLPHVPLPQQLPVANSNPLEGLTPTRHSCEQLREFFAPYNHKLWNVTGATYSW